MDNNARSETLSLSIVTPVYAGAPYLDALIAELQLVRDTWDAESAPVTLDEAIFVDDGAIDGSPAMLDEYALRYDWIHVIHLSRNFGQHSATMAGILHTSGEWVVTLDEDLQHQPQDIKHLFASVVENGNDVVYANARAAVHERWHRDLGSRGFKALMMRLTGNRFIGIFNSFRLMRGPIARAAASVCSHETYFDMALSWFTERMGAVTLDLKDERVLSGKRSGYSLGKLMSHARRMVMSAHTKSLRGGALIGIIAMTVATVFGTVLLVQKLIAPDFVDVRGWTSLFLSILLFGGIISFLASAILEYLFVVLLHIQGKPTFFVVDRREDIQLTDYFHETNS